MKNHNHSISFLLNSQSQLKVQLKCHSFSLGERKVITNSITGKNEFISFKIEVQDNFESYYQFLVLEGVQYMEALEMHLNQLDDIIDRNKQLNKLP